MIRTDGLWYFVSVSENTGRTPRPRPQRQGNSCTNLSPEVHGPSSICLGCLSHSRHSLGSQAHTLAHKAKPTTSRFFCSCSNQDRQERNGDESPSHISGGRWGTPLTWLPQRNIPPHTGFFSHARDSADRGRPTWRVSGQGS